jgi:adenylylsulfate kinase-like enzyme
MLYLITGKAGAGKTHEAQNMDFMSWYEWDNPAFLIDGDDVRDIWNDSDFTDEGRERHGVRMARIGRLAEKQGFTPIIAAITPTKKIRDLIRSHFEESKIIYIKGGSLWPGTTYEEPSEEELR